MHVLILVADCRRSKKLELEYLGLTKSETVPNGVN